MESINLSTSPTKIAEITPPLTEQWLVLSLPSNPGWISIFFPEKSQMGYPLRPGAIMAIQADYVGSIVAHLGWHGLPVPELGTLIFFSSEEQQEVESLYANAEV